MSPQSHTILPFNDDTNPISEIVGGFSIIDMIIFKQRDSKIQKGHHYALWDLDNYIQNDQFRAQIFLNG